MRVAIAIVLAVCSMSDLGIPPSAIPLYRYALTAKPPDTPIMVTFHDLWDHAEIYRGRAVQVRGTINREFTGPASGELPERVESWITSSSGDLTCLVYPASRPGPAKQSGEVPICFDGIFLGLIDYESGDVVRRAPLVVGPGPPVRERAVARPSSHEDPWGWIVGVVLLGIFAIAAGRVSLRRPPRRLTDALSSVEFES